MLKKVYAENMVDKKNRVTAIKYWKMADSSFLIYFLRKPPCIFSKISLIWSMADIDKNPFLLKFYWLYEFCFLQLLSCLLVHHGSNNFTTEGMLPTSYHTALNQLSAVALPFMEFQAQGYKISKIFGIRKINIPRGNY